MPDWLIWLVVFWVIFGCGRGCRRVYGRRGWRRDLEAGEDQAAALRDGQVGAERQLAADTHGASLPMAAAGGVAAERRPVETPLQTLQRQFVEGTMTMEQYEAALDRLDRIE